jgi:predicted RecB family nuclease
MKLDGGHLRLAASDLTTFAACAHSTALDLAVASGRRPRPPVYPDVTAQLLRERGLAHEAAYLARLRQTRTVEVLPLHAPEAAQQTLGAMQRGVDVIYQGTLQRGEWFGRPDFLVRVPEQHGAWAWSYEPADAKLALTAKVQGMLQLCFYAELLTDLQGVQPRRMTLVLGDEREETFATHRYEAYFRWLRRRMQRAIASAPATYPEPVEHCDVCDWYGECDARWRADDHLSLVAGLGSTQRRALDLAGVHKVAEFGALPPDVRVDGIGRVALTRVREQARVQVRGRQAGHLVYELVPDVESGHGLSRLPLPSPGDLFVDLEGDSFALGEGIDYLFGVAERATDALGAPRYTALWALDHASERASFERLMALIAERRAEHPDMHVYHYAPYEPTAFKRLAGRYATCVEALDDLLRAHVLVDLFGVVRQGIRASVESYSIKRLEPLYGFARDVPLPVANRNLAAFAAWLERRGTPDLPEELRAAVEGYNRDDCISALRLHAWLEERRAEFDAQRGAPLPRPEPESSEADEDLAEAIARVRAVMERLLDGVPEEAEQRDEAQNARYVLAHLLEWHRREDKSTHWEYHRLRELPDEELIEDRTAIAGLTYEGVVGQVARSLVHRYRFPPQDQAIGRAREVHDKQTRKSAGNVVLVDEAEGILDLKRGKTSQVPHPTAVIPYGIVQTDEQRASLLRLGEHVRDHGLIEATPLSSAIALLRRAPPLPSAAGSDAGETAILRALAVNGSVLPVQGPPGTGKTFLGARMIVALLRAGKRVGITANSHRVITGLLDEACKAARREDVDLRAIQKQGADEGDGSTDPLVTLTSDNTAVRRALENGTANVAAGTSWLWSRADMAAAVHVLFVDEAGQMSLANALASAPASNGIILLGDPQQLDQPQKGVHPPGVAASALGHILGDAPTMSAERGLFLEETWRMHPDVCSYISEVFYEGRLRSRSDLSRIQLHAPDPLSGTGLRFVPVQHRGNRSDSIEEAAAVASLVDRLTSVGSTWTDRHGETHPLTREDILVVTPYNAHVALLRKHVPGADVGTVDKFQGQQAPVVIYSMATSSPEDAPRGPEFLYSGNRLNVAISRARCAAFLVANPALFELRCKTERQMALANAFCRYLEVAAVCSA